MYAIVGAFAAEGGAGGSLSATGTAYIFTRSGSTWTEQQIIQLPDAQANDQFGDSVSINSDGTYAIISAPYEDGGAGDPITDAGAAYIYARSGSTWTQARKLTASDALVNDNFSNRAVSINGAGTYAIVGDQRKASYVGAAYIYEAG
jgi:hypothetical protein